MTVDELFFVILAVPMAAMLLLSAVAEWRESRHCHRRASCGDPCVATAGHAGPCRCEWAARCRYCGRPSPWPACPDCLERKLLNL